VQEGPRFRLANTAFGLAIASAALVGVTFVLAPFGAIRRPEPIWPLVVLTGLPMLAAALCAIAAVVTGHVSRRMYPGNRRARKALIVGYGLLGCFAVLMLGFWVSMTAGAH
jgi:hypothetical protein